MERRLFLGLLVSLPHWPSVVRPEDADTRAGIKVEHMSFGGARLRAALNLTFVPFGGGWAEALLPSQFPLTCSTKLAMRCIVSLCQNWECAPSIHPPPVKYWDAFTLVMSLEKALSGYA